MTVPSNFLTIGVEIQLPSPPVFSGRAPKLSFKRYWDSQLTLCYWRKTSGLFAPWLGVR